MQIKSFLQQHRIQSRRHLRDLLSDKSLQGRLSLSKAETRRLSAFENLSRVFGSRLAAALSPYVESVESLLKMPMDQLEKRLVAAALSDRNQKAFHYRLDRIRNAATAGTPPSELSEITIATGRKTDLSAADRQKITKAEIFTFDDWLLTREQIKLSKKATQTLDAYARLSRIEVAGDFAEALIQAGITSPLDYLEDPKDRVKALLKKLKISSQEAEAYQRRAMSYESGLADSILTSLIHRDESEPTVVHLGQNKPQQPCHICSPAETIFSRYAYFIYLVQRTGKTLTELDGILFQDLMNLSAADGLEEAKRRQIDIVIRVLKKALPGEPDHADQWRYRRALLKAQLTLIPTSYGRFLQTAASRLGYSGSALIDVGLRFEQLLGAGVDSQAPFFDPQEYGVMFVLLEEMFIVRQLAFIDMTLGEFVAAATQVDTGLSGPDLESRLNEAAAGNYRPDAETFSAHERLALQTVADQHLNADGFRQLVDPIRSAREEALPALRDAYIAQSGISDRDLFNRFFIEMNLPACETITPLDQAIRSLQAFLDCLAAMATDPQERAAFAYLDYAPWRSSVIAQFYPELDTLWKDGVLTGETDFFDRGSIFLDRHGHLGALREQLETVRDTIDTVRVNAGRDIAFFQQNPEEIDKDAHTRRFSNTEPFPMFMKGLETIFAVIETDDLIQQGLRELDADEPGLAVDRYRSALSRLEGVADTLFGPESIWDFDGKRGEAVYHELRKMHPGQRNLQYILLHSLLLGDTKALFMDQTLPNIGLFFIEPDQWAFPPPGAFGLNANNVIDHDRFEQHYQVEHRCYYEGGGNYTDYEFFAFVTFERGGQRLSLSIGEELGVGVRMQDHPTDRRGYGAIVATKTVGSGGGTVDRDFLQIVKKLQGSEQAILWESEDPITLANGESYRIALRCRNRIEAGNITGVELRARMTGPGTSAESPWTVDNLPITAGTFGLYCSAQIEATFRPYVSFDSPQQTTAPPFFALRRHTLENRDLLQDGNTLLQNHMNSGSPVGFDPSSIRLFRNNAFSQFEQLHGLKTLAGNQDADQFLLFQRGKDTLSLDGLDTLLEYCLMLSFHLRFAVLPLRFSQAYLQAGDYVSAAGYLHLIYDDTADTAGSAYDLRKVLPYLRIPPGGVGATESVDVKLMRLRIGDIYLAWADWLFRQNTDESKYEARQLYERVLALHGDTDYCGCFPSIGEAFQTINVIPIQANPPADADDGTTDLLRLVNRYDDLWARGIGLREYLNDRIPKDDTSGERHSADEELERLDQAIAAANQRLRKERRMGSIKRSSKDLLRSLEMELLALRSDAFFPSPTTSEGIADVTILIPAFWIITFCIPQNPIRERQRRHACHMLTLLLTCRNVLGFPKDAVPSLRFEALLELAQTQVMHARAAERDLLQFRQQYESETFSEREAANNVILTGAELTFEDLNVTQAVGDVQVATLQRNQAYHAVAHFETLIREGWTPAEYVAFGSSAAASTAALISVLPALAAGALGLTGGIMGLFGGVAKASTGVGLPAGLGFLAGGVMSLGSGFAAVASAGQSISSALGSVSATASMYASFERRDQEWRYQLGQNRFGLNIAAAQLDQALGRVDIARQRRLIAALRHDFAGDTLSFLQHRFLNAAMWLWMQKEIREQYRIRLHYATTAAFMAEQALRFDLQDDNIRVIGFDYYDPRQDGLLGATKLETDIGTLRQLKAQGEQRKLQLTKVLSLARIMPVEFEQFRRTGSLPFRTLNQWFDEDFPGHYLRLIKTVRVSVMALTPPIGGIRATLRSSGLSSTVIDTGIPGDHQFIDKTIRRESQQISFSSPIGATGLFQLSPLDDLLLPFEGLGVETDWLLELPRSSNPFDTETLADVILEIDYTALESPRYRRTVKERLGPLRRFDLSLSAKLFFPDEWYHFINSAPNGDRVLTFNLDAAFIPGNIKPGTARAYHLSMMVTGEWTPTEASALTSLFRLQKDGLTWTGSTSPAAGEVMFETIQVEAGGVVYSTRSSGGQTGQGELVNVLAAGQWVVRASAAIDSLDDNGTGLLARINDIIITISVEGVVLG